MFSLLRYLPLAVLFNDVTDQVKAAGVEKRPWYLQRTVIGAIMALGAGFLAIQFGVKFTPEDIGTAADSITTVATTCVTAYGVVLSIYGAVMKAVNANKVKA